ncbi:hypothetical protein KUCAC02_024340, partial [Chaenocephalus aceratus]
NPGPEALTHLVAQGERRTRGRTSVGRNMKGGLRLLLPAVERAVACRRLCKLWYFSLLELQLMLVCHTRPKNVNYEGGQAGR